MRNRKDKILDANHMMLSPKHWLHELLLVSFVPIIFVVIWVLLGVIENISKSKDK